MLRIAAVAVVLALLPAAGAAQPVMLHLVADGDELRLADEPAAAVVPLVADGDRDPLLTWQSAPLEHAYLEGHANVTLYLEGAGGPRYASLLADDGNASRVLASGQFGQSGILPSHDNISLDVSGQQIHAGERLSLILRVADPVGAVLLTGPETPSHLTLPVVDAPRDEEAGADGEDGGRSGGASKSDPASGDGTARQPTDPAVFDPSSLAQPVVAWILAVGVAAVSIGLAARGTGRW